MEEDKKEKKSIVRFPRWHVFLLTTGAFYKINNQQNLPTRGGSNWLQLHNSP